MTPAAEQPHLELAQVLLAAAIGVGDERANRDAARHRRGERLLQLRPIEAEDDDVDRALRALDRLQQRREALVGLDDQFHGYFALFFFSDQSTAACPSGSSRRMASVTRSRSTSKRYGDFVAELLVGRGAQLVLELEAAQNGSRCCRPQLVGLVAGLDRQIELLQALLERFDDAERDDQEHRREDGERIQSDARGQPDGERAEHHHRILGIVDLRSIADQVGGADDAERARQAGADDEHDDGADNREDDLRLDDRRHARRRALASAA